MLKATFPVFETVTAWALAAVPQLGVNVSPLGETLTMPAVPCPVMERLHGRAAHRPPRG